MWNRTMKPLPRFSAVTSGVPSASRAQLRSDNSTDGSARTCRVTDTSGGIARPAKGLESENGASFCGSAQASAPPR